MTRPRAADDFATIRARVEKLRREAEQVEGGQTDLRSAPPMRPYRSIYWSDGEVGRAEPGSPIQPNPQAARSRGAFLILA